MNYRTILLVEDDPNDIFFMKRSFKEAGVINPCRVLEDGREAIAYLNGDGTYGDRARHPLPCLVLLDLKLPYVLGLDVLKWIRTRPALNTTVVVVLTSSKDDADIERAYDLGANSYLVKPPDAEKLFEMVRRIKGYWLEENQMPAGCIEFEHAVRLAGMERH